MDCSYCSFRDFLDFFDNFSRDSFRESLGTLAERSFRGFQGIFGGISGNFRKFSAGLKGVSGWAFEDIFMGVQRGFRDVSKSCWEFQKGKRNEKNISSFIWSLVVQRWFQGILGAISGAISA